MSRKKKGHILYMAAVILLLLLQVSVPLYGASLSGRADVTPWSGYWWPLSRGELVKGYNGHPAPIEKYDLYTNGRYPGYAASMAEKVWYDPDVPYWVGFCHGWANASILEHINFQPSAVSGLFLAVGDKKGLLAAIHAEDEVLYEYCNNPEPFHRYLLKYIGEEGQAVAADLDSSGEFWSYPIYSYEMEIKRGEQADQVQCRIKHANDLGFSPDFEGTVEVEATYFYTLDKDSSGNYIKGRGSWEGASVKDHPDIVWVPIARRPDRLFIDYDTVKAMALSSGDECPDEKSLLVPGHHLVMLRQNSERRFDYTPRQGETLTLKVALDRQSAEIDAMAVLELDGETIVEHQLDRDLYEIKLKTQTGKNHYRFKLIAGEKNQTGCSIHLYISYGTPYQRWFYGCPSSLFWLGNSGLMENSGKINIELAGDQGLPFGVGEVAEIGACEQHLTVLSTATMTDYFSKNKPLAVKVCSSEPLSGLTFAGNEKCFYGSTGTSVNQAKKVVIPWLTSNYNMAARSDLYLAQLGSEDNQLKLDYYKDDGTFFRQEELSLPAERVALYQKGSYPGGANLNGWALMRATENGIDGAVLRSVGDYIKDELPLLNVARTWVLAHPAVGYGGWRTGITLYNPSPRPLRVALCCHAGVDGLNDYIVEIAGFARKVIDLDGTLWGISEPEINAAWITLKGDADFAGFATYGFGTDASASLPLSPSSSAAHRVLPQIADNYYWWTGLIFVNRADKGQEIKLTAYAADGEKLEVSRLTLVAEEKFCDVVGSLFSKETMARGVASLTMEGGENISAVAILGTMAGANRISAISW
jgi:hypothetical protein